MWGKGQRGKGVPHLLVSSALFNGLSDSPVRLWGSPTTATPAVAHSHLLVPLSQPLPHSPPSWAASPTPNVRMSLWFFWVGPPGPLPYWFDCTVFFFISLVAGVPCSLIFWHFWLFIDFRLVVVLLLVVPGSEGFLPMPPSWLELEKMIFNFHWQMQPQNRILYSSEK